MITCLPVDDEPLALDLLEDNISKVPFLKLVGKCTNAFEAAEVLQREEVDLIFLDIQMPGLTGLQFLRSLTHRPMVIFVTAFQHHALEGFELAAIDYLMKPVSVERFLLAATKANEWKRMRSHGGQMEVADHIFIQADYRWVKVDLEQIWCVEGLKDYVKIHLRDRRSPIVTRLSMRSMESYLPPSQFCRIHRSYIISLPAISTIGRGKVTLFNETEFPISEQYRDAFMAVIANRSVS